MTLQSNPRAPYRLSTEHPRLSTFGGKSLIVHIVVNVEYWPYDEPAPRQIVTPPHGKTTIPDLPNFCWSEYGNRCGMPRLLKLFGDYRIPVSASVNASVIDVYPALASAMREQGWEFVGHGVRQRGLGSEADERAQIRTAIARLQEYVGRRLRGWMSPGWSETFDTLDYLHEAGIEYVCQWVIDDIPTKLHTKHGEMIALPYALDLNDSVIYAIEKHSSPEMQLRVQRTLEVFAAEAREYGQPRVLTIALHPHLSGVPHRIGYLRETIETLLARSDTVFMAGGDIVDWYLGELAVSNGAALKA